MCINIPIWLVIIRRDNNQPITSETLTNMHHTSGVITGSEGRTSSACDKSINNHDSNEFYRPISAFYCITIWQYLTNICIYVYHKCHYQHFLSYPLATPPPPSHLQYPLYPRYWIDYWKFKTDSPRVFYKQSHLIYIFCVRY